MVVRSYRYIIQLLVLTVSLVVLAITQLPDGNIHVIACDVGQGDAILITYKNIQVLTDGGPNDSVLNCLGNHVPFWDRTIELIILSHPDSDHATGLIDVIKRYNVGSIVMNKKDPGTQVYRLLENAVGGQGVGVIEPTKGMVLRLDLIHLDIVSQYDPTISDTNYNSIVYKLKFKGFSGMFLGDIPPKVSDTLAETVEQVNYIKVPHHGSVNGMTPNLLNTLMPKVAVISVGAKNPWGFPRPEILQMLKEKGVDVLRTDLMGDVEVMSDGEKIWWKN